MFFAKWQEELLVELLSVETKRRVTYVWRVCMCEAEVKFILANIRPGNNLFTFFPSTKRDICRYCIRDYKFTSKIFYL